MRRHFGVTSINQQLVTSVSLYWQKKYLQTHPLSHEATRFAALPGWCSLCLVIVKTMNVSVLLRKHIST